MSPSRTQVAAAVETLLASGWQITPPASERLQLLTPRQVADLVGCGLPRAREIITALPGSLRIPGGELRARIPDLESWMEQHRITA
jgi:hypothetical protein